MQNSYQVNGDYETNDIETLSKFVEECIRGAIPTKYIANNVYLISHPDLKGDGSQGNDKNPIWGQTRLVLFPMKTESIVYKIAISGIGIRANKSEYMITQKFSNIPEAINLIAKIIDKTSNSVIISAKRLKTLPKEEWTKEYGKEVIAMKEKLRKIQNKHKLPIDMTKDIHRFNVGYDDDIMKVIDYGLTKRKF